MSWVDSAMSILYAPDMQFETVFTSMLRESTVKNRAKKGDC